MKESLLRSLAESELQALDDNLDNPLSQQPSLYHGEVSGHSGPVNWAAFSPDSCRLLTCSDDKTSRLLNLFTKNVVVLRGHDAAVTFGEFSRGSAAALTCSRDGSVRLWHSESASVLHILRPSSPAHTATFSLSGAQLVCCCDDNKARIFSCSSGDEIVALCGHTARIRTAVFSRDGSRVLTSSDDGSARLWSVESGRQLNDFKGHASKKLCCASFSNDDMKVMTCSEVTPVHPRSTRVWSCDSGELLIDADKTTAESTSRHLSQRPLGCESVFSPDGLYVVTVSDDRQCMRLILATTGELSLILGPFSEGLLSFQFSDDGLLLLLCCGDGSCHIFCSRSFVLFLSIRSPLAAHVSSAGQPLLSARAFFSPDCRQVGFLPIGSCSVYLHSLQSSCLQTPYTQKHMHAGRPEAKRKLTSACVDYTGTKILSCTDDRLAVVFSCVSGHEILTLSGHTKALRSAVFSRDGSKILTSSDDGSARLWSSETGFELTKIVFEIMDEAARSNVLSQLQSGAASQDNGHIAGAALSPDNALIATCSSLDHSIRVWNAKTGQMIEWPKSHAAHHVGTITSIQFCSCSMFVTSSLDGSVRLWAALTGQRTTVFEGQACVCVVLQPVVQQSQLFLEEPVIKTILVTSQHEAVLATLSSHAPHAAIPFGRDCGGVTNAIFSPSGSYFAASHENGSCTVHSSAAGTLLWQLISHKGRVNCVVFAGSDRFLLTSGYDKLVVFWQLPAIPPKSAPVLLQPLFSLPFHVEIARLAAVGDSVVFAAADTRISSHIPCVCSDGALNLGASLSLSFDGGLLKYLSDPAVAATSKNGLFSRYLLPPVWIIESILASSHDAAKEQLRSLLQGPAAGAVALHERFSRPSLLSSLASKGNTESLSFLLRLHAPGIPFLVGPLLLAAAHGATQHKSDSVALILRHFSSKISVPGEFPFFVHEKDNICSAIVKAFKDSDLLHDLLQFFKQLPMQPSTVGTTFGLERAVRAPFSENCFWIARASRRMFPQDFWKEDQLGSAAGKALSVASAAVTPFAMCGAVLDNNQSLLRSACDLDGGLSREFFSCLLFQVIVSFKWIAFGRRRCIVRLLRYLLFQCLLMLLSSSFATEHEPGIRSVAVFACIASVLPLAWEIHHIIYHTVASARQVSGGSPWCLRLLTARYFKDFWNVYDLIRVVFTAAALAAVAANSRSNSAWLLSVAMYLRWLGLLFFLMPFESTGPLVRMIFQIAYGIRWLLLVLAIAIVAVAHSFWILIGKNPSGDACDGIDDFDNVGVSLFSAFNMLVLGVFQIDTFTKCGGNQVVSRFLFLFSMVFVPIVLLNLLIAIMSYNFHQVKTHEQSELFKLRARIILDIETFMSDEERSDDQLFPNFFQILQRKTSKTTEDIVKSDVYSRLDAQMAAVEELCAKTQCAFAAKDAALAEMSRTLQLLLERSASVS